MKSPFRFVLGVALLFLMPVTSHAQFTRIGGGPSGAQVAGVIAGVPGVRD